MANKTSQSGKISQGTPLIKPPKKVLKEELTDKDIVGMQSPLRKIQYEISKAKGKQVR